MATSTAVDVPPLNGRVAIITGAARGIGRAIATHLRSLGAKVVINYVTSSTQADLIAAEFNSKSPSSTVAIAVKADVSSETDVQHLFDRAEQEFGAPAHIMVNCAGTLDSTFSSIANTTVDIWETTFDVNTKGSFLCCREASKRLARGGGGRMVFITSSLVGSLIPGYGAYAASKAAVETMTKIAAKELKGSGITVNCVAPGPVASDLFFAGKSEEMVQMSVDACPMGRLGEATDVAPLVGFLVSDGGAWVNGQIIRINGGSVV
ncbi:NADPH-dependent aldehyde reductase-like protein, chloroplastic [Primulina tabacum]|uniref:NADPH-dependent aldehyde reductase-like protein, chloroplastic n=1 Tax=Primulina tabacum TaxID=48773 RepID=UPI003F5A12F2